jgi:ABC-type metal ion transport system, periplasmic component/surface adhesin
MLKKFLLLVLTLGTMVSLAGCGSIGANDAVADTGKVHVSVSFDAMREFVEAVGKDKVAVSVIIPDGTEPHDFEPKAEDLKGLNEAQIFVYNGLGMETWAEKAVQAAGNSKLIAVKASTGIEAIKNTDEGEIKEHGVEDPHSWLSLKNAEIEVRNIKDALVEADPTNKAYYEKNCKDYTDQLENLYQKYQTKFATVERKDFVTGHAAFSYFCRDFGLQQNSVEDVFAEGEPNAAQLAELIEYSKKHQVKTIFVEDMVSPAVSQTLANEVGAEVQTIYTMESHEDQKNYLERMQDNLDKIYSSLK